MAGWRSFAERALWTVRDDSRGGVRDALLPPRLAAIPFRLCETTGRSDLQRKDSGVAVTLRDIVIRMGRFDSTIPEGKGTIVHEYR